MRCAGFKSRLEALALIEPVVWVLEHLDRTFGTSIMREINREGGVTEEYLKSERVGRKAAPVEGHDASAAAV